MKILLDENITPMAKSTLIKYGHDVIHIRDIFEAGLSDDSVFAFALKEKRAVITINGKDFIVYIPPVKPNSKYYGLIWFRNFSVTKKNCEQVMDTIGQYFEYKESIVDKYYSVKKNNEVYKITQRYPQEQNVLMIRKA